MIRDTLGLFIAGTDTGVGKSLIACALVRWLRAASIDSVGFKPVATGEVAGEWSDAVGLYEASERCEPIEKICPFRFKAPKAPTIAARHEGIEADINLARWAVAELCSRHTAVIVEGVGGLLSPLDESTLNIDFAVQLGFPVLLVIRASIGTINHTLLSLREIERSQMRLAGIVMNVTNPADEDSTQETCDEIERISGQKVAAVVPYLLQAKAGPAPTRAAMVARAIASMEDQLDLKRLLGLEGRRKKQGTKRYEKK
ncbi:MAG TPA: dethiobiotin synthase [Planctomycetota bacterium]|nr:dethiobiotin synthase [Planctomycetota bacterium]